MRIALFQPEIPQNTGTILRLGACMNVPVDIIEPCSFVISDKRLQRAGMDYIDLSNYKLHNSWDAYQSSVERSSKRLVLLTPHTDNLYQNFQFDKSDILLLGRESDGVPKEVASQCDELIRIPMIKERRSLNVAVSCAIVLGEALRQTNSFPEN